MNKYSIVVFILGFGALLSCQFSSGSNAAASAAADVKRAAAVTNVHAANSGPNRFEFIYYQGCEQHYQQYYDHYMSQQNQLTDRLVKMIHVENRDALKKELVANPALIESIVVVDKDPNCRLVMGILHYAVKHLLPTAFQAFLEAGANDTLPLIKLFRRERRVEFVPLTDTFPELFLRNHFVNIWDKFIATKFLRQTLSAITSGTNPAFPLPVQNIVAEYGVPLPPEYGPRKYKYYLVKEETKGHYEPVMCPAGDPSDDFLLPGARLESHSTLVAAAAPALIPTVVPVPFLGTVIRAP
jgi:hypothetical protein